MPDLKLGKLPDRTPVKITITVNPALNEALQAYARAYEATYQQAEKVSDLIPYMLQCFLDGDRTFAKALKEGELNLESIESTIGARQHQRSQSSNGPPASMPNGGK